MSIPRKPWLFRATLTSSVSAFVISMGLGVLSTASAQSTTADETKEVDEVVVTGSRIKRSGLTTPSPVTVLDRSDIELNVNNDLTTALIDLPSVSGDTLQGRFSLINESGSSNYNLRGLGSARTLTLIDGKRVVGARHGSTVPDGNSIASEMIDRVEIITGGASSVYGSDAIAGVVNIITRQDFDGMKLRTEVGDSAAGDHGRTRVAGLIGASSSDGRGRALVALDFENEQEVLAKNREWPQNCFYNMDATVAQAATMEAGGWSRLNCNGAHSNSSIIDGLRLSIGNTTASQRVGAFWVDRDGLFHSDAATADNVRLTNALLGSTSTQNIANFNPGTSTQGNLSQWEDRNKAYEQYGYNHMPETIISPVSKRRVISAKGSYDINDNLEAYVNLTWSSADVISRRTPATISSGNTDDYYRYGRLTTPAVTVPPTLPTAMRMSGIPIDNPFITSTMRTAILAHPNYATLVGSATSTANGMVNFDKRLTQMGAIQFDVVRDVTRAVLGVQGNLGSSSWEYDLSYVWGRMHQSQVYDNRVSWRAVAAALDLESVTVSGTNPTGFRCADPEMRSRGCVPVDLVSKNGLSPQMLAWIGATESFRSFNVQQVVAGSVTGDLFDLPAGTVGSAFGVEARTEFNEVRTDTLSHNGLDGGLTVPNNGGEFDVNEVFAEFRFPVLANLPAVQALDIEMAARFANYSHQKIETVDNYNLALNWTVTDDLGIRAVASRATRAPDIRDSFSVGRGTTWDLSSDPCRGLMSGNASGLVDQKFAAGCLNDPMLLAFFAANPTSTFNGGTTSEERAVNIGNPNIFEETGTTYTLGIIFTPTVLPDFSMTFDAFEITIDDAIGQPERQRIVEECYDGSGFELFCPLIQRRELTEVNPGHIKIVDGFPVNSDTRVVSGLDIETRYKIDLGDLGNLDLKLLYTRVNQDYQINIKGDGETSRDDFLGEVDSPKSRLRLTTTYRNGPFSISWKAKYRDNVITDDNDRANFDNLGSTVAADQSRFMYIPSYIYHDLSSSIKFGSDDAYRLTLNIANLADREPPFVPDGIGGGIGNDSRLFTFPEYYDAVGRDYKLSLNMNF